MVPRRSPKRSLTRASLAPVRCYPCGAGKAPGTTSQEICIDLARKTRTDRLHDLLQIAILDQFDQLTERLVLNTIGGGRRDQDQSL